MTLSVDPDRVDRIAHILVGVGNVLHTIGASILRGRNEQLTEDLAGARQLVEANRRDAADVREVLKHAYELAPEVVEAAAARAGGADVDEDQDDEPDVDEHQDHEPSRVARADASAPAGNDVSHAAGNDVSHTTAADASRACRDDASRADPGDASHRSSSGGYRCDDAADLEAVMSAPPRAPGCP